MTQFTVIVPTHDHAETLWFSLGSVLAQTVQDFEVIVVGDGAPPRTGEIVAALAERDSRIRYLAKPKSERHGELSRHEALASAQGRYVAYQCDDDLWFPDHLETLARMLEDHDLAHTMQVDVTPDGHADAVMFDVRRDPHALERMRRNEVGFGLASGGHTMEAYRRLPHGWRPAPKETHSDLFFWLQFLEQPWCRYASHTWPGVLHSAAIPPSWNGMRRAAELAPLAARLPDPAWREALVRRSLVATHDRTMLEMRQLAKAIPVHAYSADNVYPLGEKLLFSRWGNAFRYRIGGAYPQEGWGTWARGTLRVTLPLAPDERIGSHDMRLSLELVHLLGEPARAVSRARVCVNGEPVAEIEERTGGPRRYDIELPAALATPRAELVVEIEGLEPAIARSIGLNDDRELAVGIISLAIDRA
ncbi:MAG: hypothetical protein QOD51_1671 [Candidatus Eremiobacteraeota bacterium]|jgi:glycosyltransferase involved in cell wall biosynthesis|nr:hypothetical protein [Candidatus Eremiobacteraeota bacterium]